MVQSIVDLRGPVRRPLSNEKPRQLVILLHGIGSNGEDMIGMAEVWSPALPEAEFFAPHAPEPFDMLATAPPSTRQWFSLKGNSIEKLQDNIRIASKFFNRALDRTLEQRNLTDKDLCLVGFSQGSMLALYSAIRRPRVCACVVSFSGTLVEDTDKIVSKPPILLIHGEEDETVPFSALAKSEHLLKQQGFTVSTMTRPIGHEVDLVGLEEAGRFLCKYLLD